MHYRGQPVELYTNTLEAGLLFRQQNRYDQVFRHHNSWVQVMPIQKKSGANEVHSHLFVNDGVSRAIIMDGSKEQTMGDFRKKAQLAACHTRQT